MNNPEFLKNYWLEMTPHRLIATPVILFLLLVLTFLAFPERESFGEKLDVVLFTIAIAFSCFAGASSTMNSMVAEFTDNTWDQQRMSPLSPWSLTWGKTFGGAIFSWYGTVICLVLYFLLPPFFASDIGLVLRIKMILALLASAIFAQSLSLLMVINIAGSSRRLSRYRRGHGVGAGLLLLVLVTYLFRRFFDPSADGQGIQIWFGQAYLLLDFWLLTIWLFAMWTSLGAYRVLRQQMQYENGLGPWILFNIFLMTFFTGFYTDALDGSPLSLASDTSFLGTAYGIGLLLSYATLLTQPLHQMDIRFLAKAIADFDQREIWNKLPLWFASLCVTIVATTVYLLHPDHPEQFNFGKFPAFVFVLFFVRDALLITGLALGGNPQRLITTSLMYLFLLYVVISTILSLLGLNFLLGFFSPVHAVEFSLLPIFVEVVGFAVWFGFRLKRVILIPLGIGATQLLQAS